MTEPNTRVPETETSLPPKLSAPGLAPGGPSARKYNTVGDISRAMEHLIGLGLNGTISPTELKVYQSALKTLADLLPKTGEAATVPISERLKARLLADPDLLEEMSALIPREQLQDLFGNSR